jgi:hypothetical protein
VGEAHIDSNPGPLLRREVDQTLRSPSVHVVPDHGLFQNVEKIPTYRLTYILHITSKNCAKVNKCKEEKRKEIQTEGFCSVFLSYSLVLQEKQTTPRSPLKVNMLLAICFTLVSCLANFSTLKMELIYSSETPVSLYWTTQGNSPDITALHNNRCENLKSQEPSCRRR